MKTQALIPGLLLMVISWTGAPGAAPTGTAGTPAVDVVEDAETPAPEAAPAPTEGEPEAPATEAADDPHLARAADLYLRKCAGCHTVGGGELLGPDLLPSTGWPEPDLTLAVERMEKNVGPLPAEEVQALVDLLKSPAVTERLDDARERQMEEVAASLEPPDARVGRALFFGDRMFDNGGLSCMACHRAGARGGTLAADLTDSFQRLGRSALLSAAENPGFPLMKAAYATHPVTRQEAVHLAEYLASLEPAEAATAAGGGSLGLAGTVAAALFLLAMVALYRRRNRGVRRRLVERAARS